MGVMAADALTCTDEALHLGDRGVTLVLTAAAAPGRRGPGRPDPVAHACDYADALAFYVGLLGDSVQTLVFATSAGRDLERLQALADRSPHADRVELLNFPEPDHGSEHGRAYQEFKLLDRVMSSSRLIGHLGSADKVWKVTGRYRVLNLPELVARAPERFDVYCNAPNWPIRAVDLGVLAWSLAGYEAAFRGVYRELREDRLRCAPEVHLRAVLDRLSGRIRVVRRHATEPRIAGVRGAVDRNECRHGPERDRVRLVDGPSRPWACV
jgi:hypothetical protein